MAQPGEKKSMVASLDSRRSGILCHITSLPGGIFHGDLGKPATRFAAFLHEAGQSWWQILPINPIGGDNSPYSTHCSVAGEPLLINLDWLAEDGLLDIDWRRPAEADGSPSADYRLSRKFRRHLWRQAYLRFDSMAAAHQSAEYMDFQEQESFWLDDYAVFRAIALEMDTVNWADWPEDLRCRHPAALQQARRRLDRDIQYVKFLQFQFHRQWRRLRQHCHQLGIGLIGDIAMFVSLFSSEVWAHPQYFELDENHRPTRVAGVPPDQFAPEGQLWGNALYRWQQMERDGFVWWINRLGKMLRMFDALRLDHFIGFHRYWAIPSAAETAQEGRWVEGPGPGFFERLFDAFDHPKLIAEDLGSTTSEVEALRNQFGIPGMRVLQFGFAAGADCFHRPHSYPADCVAYTGTHDTETAIGLCQQMQRPDSRLDGRRMVAYFGEDISLFHWRMVESLFKSAANMAILPIQDLLGLGSDSRMNIPGTCEGNWRWRLSGDLLTDELCQRLRRLTWATDRIDRE